MPRAATRRTSRCTSSFALLLAAAAVSATGDASSSARAGCPCRDFFSADGMYVRAIECHVWANADDFSDCAADQLSSLTERRACTVLRHDLPFAGAWSQQLCDELRGDAGRRCRVAPLGLTLRAPAPEQSGCAYAFDAWSGRSGGEHPPCPPAERESGAPSPAALAAARLEATVALCARGERAALGERLGADGALNCCFARARDAIAAQLEYERLARHNRSACETADLGGRYNQIDRAWRATDVTGVFVARPSQAAREQAAALRTALAALTGGRRPPLVHLASRTTAGRGCTCSFGSNSTRRR